MIRWFGKRPGSLAAVGPLHVAPSWGTPVRPTQPTVGHVCPRQAPRERDAPAPFVPARPCPAPPALRSPPGDRASSYDQQAACRWWRPRRQRLFLAAPLLLPGGTYVVGWTLSARCRCPSERLVEASASTTLGAGSASPWTSAPARARWHAGYAPYAAYLWMNSPEPVRVVHRCPTTALTSGLDVSPQSCGCTGAPHPCVQVPVGIDLSPELSTRAGGMSTARRQPSPDRELCVPKRLCTGHSVLCTDPPAAAIPTRLCTCLWITVDEGPHRVDRGCPLGGRRSVDNSPSTVPAIYPQARTHFVHTQNVPLTRAKTRFPHFAQHR